MYVIEVTEHLNYGDDKTFFYAKEYDSIKKWLEKNYPFCKKIEVDYYCDEDGDCSIEISHATTID